MGKKRKSVASRLDEVDRTIYSTFCSAANSLSQLYTQTMNQQKVSFQAGERHALEKLYQWILSQHEEGSRVAPADIVAYLQNELDYGEDGPTSPRLPFQHHHSQPATMPFANPSMQTPSVLFVPPTGGLGSRPGPGHSDQTKNSVFSNALSSPTRQSLQAYQLAQADGYYTDNILSTGNGNQNSEAGSPNPNRDAHSLGPNDTSMDIHSDNPACESY